MKRVIEIDSNLKYFLIRDSADYYRAIIPEQFSIDTKFNSAYYDNSDNIIANAKAFKGLSGTLKPKRITRKDLTIKYIDNKHYNILNLNDTIAIYDMINTKYGSLCLVEKENTSSYDLLKSDNYSLISLLDPSSFNLIENKISYKDLFNYYNINHFIYSHGVICQLYEGQYAYLNPWNGIFFTFQDSIQDSLQIRGYLELLISDNPSVLKYKSSNYNYRYKVMSLSFYNGKAIVNLKASDKDNKIAFSILQVYNINNGLKKEIVLNSSTNKYFQSYLLKIDNDFLYFLYQYETEEWRIISIPIGDVF